MIVCLMIRGSNYDLCPGNGISVISMGVVFNIHIQVLGIRYFQRPCASYHCRISVISEGLVFYSHIQVLGIRYF